MHFSVALGPAGRYAVFMTINEMHKAEEQQVARRYREITAEACEMRADGRLADDYEAAMWITEQQDRVARAPWG